MTYNEFCKEIKKRMKNTKTETFMFLQKGYIPVGIEMTLIVLSANKRLSINYDKYLVEDFLIITTDKEETKKIAYLPLEGLYDYFKDGGWMKVMDTITEILEKMKK